ncbi:uncharacterized protein AC631_02227 [Debaryomyces fabryi]|uniref:AN1-type domain-containing protein n=1 Tax=Debaryomyces fabryi TaxID=58627 RepID=A0A0V1Q0F9_9ASCO|nr:uncharacterized protein AC631_02227 [Debaryomyces fabryi]KSA02014.1 hypothetical protein AC631_02227 [Debaryomyces fabryi]CUM51331.1 unnamed protein product [Debaryomyces fabryi]
MSQAGVNKNLFVNETKVHPDQGIMNIGKQCHKCQQVDFLPFHCEYCKFTYCSNHRSLDSHQCPVKPQEKTRSSQQYDATAASLFPDREKDKIKLENSINNATPKATNILGRNGAQGNVIAKFAKFLRLQKNKKSTDDKVMGLFKKKSVPSARTKVADMAILRREAKGDTKVSDTDKIYLWCLYINPKQVSDNAEEDIFSNIDVHKEKRAVWVSKQWSVGRALDSIADNLSIVNINNRTRESDERLCICKVSDDELPVLLETSDRCLKAFRNADLIYLVRGKI